VRKGKAFELGSANADGGATDGHVVSRHGLRVSVWLVACV
jgi:hypothetical protein